VVEFRFRQPENLSVLACDKVRARKSPILFVCRDADGDWQFLCGDDHPDEGDDGAALVCLKDVVEWDESVNDLAGLCPLGEATRERRGAAWTTHDGMEEVVRRNVTEHACHVMKVEADDEGPGFAYSIGLTQTYGQPEFICFGLRDEVMHWMINEVRDRIAQGERFGDGMKVGGLLEGYDCVLRQVQRTNYREYLGYARWFYDGDSFDALQIVWPDKQSRYPWDPGYDAPPDQQPATWQTQSA
jgi:hypothetical protein